MRRYLGRRPGVKLNVKALTTAAALIWGAAILFVSLANLARPAYGREFLAIVSSIYPGYHASGSVGDAIIGTSYALVDGAVFGLVFGWLYNVLTEKNASMKR
jgi:hypothetical protein